MSKPGDRGPSLAFVGPVSAEDRSIPSWWLWLLAILSVTAFCYWMWLEVFRASPAPIERYTEERLAALANSPETSEEELVALSGDEMAMRAAASMFAANCSKCHGARGEGGIGPNLTDPFWIRGGSAMSIYQTIYEGRSLEGMPGWGLLLGPGKTKQLAAYVLTIRDINLPGKAAEGERYRPASP